MTTAVTKRNLPSLNDLYNDVEYISKQNDLNILLNGEPKREWIKEHPMAKGVVYLPIERIEYLLTFIFAKWRVEVKEVKVIANSVQVTVRLHVLDPITGEWDWQDGIGAAPIQTRKGASASDTSSITNDAVVKAAPSAKSYAVKDAAECFGKIFGKDLNRKEILAYTGLDGKVDLSMIECSPEQLNTLKDLTNSATLTPEENKEYWIRFGRGISREEYSIIWRELMDRQVSPIDKVRNGENVSQKEIKAAIKERIA